MPVIMIVGIVVILIVVGLFFLVAIKASGDNKRDINHDNLDSVTSKPLLTVSEKLFYDAIKEAVPNHNILIKVSLSSLLKSSSQAMRNQYNRRSALFVVIDEKTNVIALIDIAKKTSKSESEKASQIDNILLGAGYKLLRYDQVPMAVVLKEEILN